MQDYEYTLLSKPEKVIMYNLPPVSTSKGHYLDNWKEMIWEGGVRVVAKNDVMEVQFINKDKTIYAVAPIPQNYTEAIQKTVDSQRGFVVRLANKGKFAWIGIAFRERNDAFDFNVCFDDFEQKRDLMKNPDKYANEFKSDMDYNIKQGEKLKLDFQFDDETSKKTKSRGSNADGSIKLAPPPNQFGSQPQKQQQQNQQQDFGNFGSSGWGSEWNNSSKQNSNQSQQQSNNFENFSDFKDFGNFSNFGNSNNNNNQQQQQQQFQQQSQQNNNFSNEFSQKQQQQFNNNNNNNNNNKVQETNLLDL